MTKIIPEASKNDNEIIVAMAIFDENMKMCEEFLSLMSTDELLMKDGIEVIKQIGTGSFSKVYKCSKGGKIVALKLAERKSEERVKVLSNGYKILSLISHENIVKLLGKIETETFFGVYLEFLEGVELFDFIKDNHLTYNEASVGLREADTRVIMRQLLEGK